MGTFRINEKGFTMQVQWIFEGCKSELKKQCRSYWAKKQERLNRLLSGIPHGAKHLRIAIFYNQAQVEQFEARGVRKVPGRTLVAQFAEVELLAVLDSLADKLIAATKKFKERSSHFIRQNRKKHITEDLLEAESLLAWDEKAKRKESFFIRRGP